MYNWHIVERVLNTRAIKWRDLPRNCIDLTCIFPQNYQYASHDLLYIFLHLCLRVKYKIIESQEEKKETNGWNMLMDEQNRDIISALSKVSSAICSLIKAHAETAICARTDIQSLAWKLFASRFDLTLITRPGCDKSAFQQIHLRGKIAFYACVVRQSRNGWKKASFRLALPALLLNP